MGIPAVHQLRAAAQPPVTRYTGAHSPPNSRPKQPERRARLRGGFHMPQPPGGGEEREPDMETGNVPEPQSPDREFQGITDLIAGRRKVIK